MRPRNVTRAALFASLVLLAACSGSAGDAVGETTSSAGETQQSQETSTTSASAPSEETTTTEDTREVAPDFTLALGGGGTFTLSEADNPVLLVFWAEW